MAVDAARAKSLFLAASDLADPAERAAYLECECSGDADLRARVEALLHANDAAPLPSAHEATVDSGDGQPGTEDYEDPTARVGDVRRGLEEGFRSCGIDGHGSPPQWALLSMPHPRQKCLAASGLFLTFRGVAEPDPLRPRNGNAVVFWLH